MITDVPGICLVTSYADYYTLFCGSGEEGHWTEPFWMEEQFGKIGKVTVEKMEEEFGCDPADILGQ